MWLFATIFWLLTTLQGWITLILLIAYGWGVRKFWLGYSRTNFQPGFVNRLSLSFLWPILLPVNRSYRKNFQKALRGR